MRTSSIVLPSKSSVSSFSARVATYVPFTSAPNASLPGEPATASAMS